ncbi:hypothetical protein ABT084_10680 [Streptomyces sp. NPDC002138]|uniref:hypothetical protein n=1 Tax=Streptomyces sp. NPDC002138 TaxID=3154410 RepID=UPI00331AAAEC
MTNPPLPEPFLTLHTAFVLVTAALIGCLVGVLTHLGGTRPAPAVLAGLTAAAGAVPGQRSLIR